MRLIKLLSGLGLAVLSTVLFASAAIAYQGQVAGQVVVSGPDFVIACGFDWTLSAHVTEAGTGNPIQGQTVHWTLVTSPDPGDFVSPADTVTDANGNTSVTLQVGATFGQRTIEAKADDVTSRFTVDCESGGLPPTSVAPTSDPIQSGFSWVWLAAVAAVVAGFAIIGLRFVRR